MKEREIDNYYKFQEKRMKLANSKEIDKQYTNVIQEMLKIERNQE